MRSSLGIQLSRLSRALPSRTAESRVLFASKSAICGPRNAKSYGSEERCARRRAGHSRPDDAGRLVSTGAHVLVRGHFELVQHAVCEHLTTQSDRNWE